MFGTFLERLEDPKRRLLGPTISSFRAAGLLMPRNPILRFLRLFIHLMILCSVSSMFAETYILRDDLNLLYTTLKFAMLSGVSFFKILSFIFFQKKWYKVFDYIPGADQFERDSQNEFRKKIIDKYTKQCRQVTYIYWIIVLIAHISMILRSVILYSRPEYREQMRNGTAPFPHIVNSWMPVDKETSPGCWLTLAWQYFSCFNGILLNAAYDAGIVVFMIFFGGKFDLLRERCRHLYGVGEHFSEDDLRANVQEVHTIHVELIKHCRMLDSLISPVMFLYLIVCSLMLCSSIVQLTTETRLLQKWLLAPFIMFEVAQLFVLCLASSDCLVKSQAVSQGPYESAWWRRAASPRQTRLALLLSGQLQRTFTFSAGPFADLNLPTFIAVMKGAYSYYTLLRD